MKHLLYASLVFATCVCGMEYSEVTSLIEAEEIETVYQPDHNAYPCHVCDIIHDTNHNLQKHLDSLAHKMKVAIIHKHFMSSFEQESRIDDNIPMSPPALETPCCEPQPRMASTSIHKRKQCPYTQCKKILRGSLKNHLLTHTQQKPYHCSLCEYAAAQSTNCARHIRAMHHQRMQKAHIVYKTENSKPSIIRVSRTAFTCTACNKTYTEKNSYLRHISVSKCKSKL